MDLTHDTDHVYSKEKDKEAETDTSTPSSETACVQDREDSMSRRTGDIQIYLYYVKAVGVVATLVFVAAIVGFIFCVSFPSKFSSLSPYLTFHSLPACTCLVPLRCGHYYCVMR